MMELAGGQMTGTLGREVISTRQRKIAELGSEPIVRRAVCLNWARTDPREPRVGNCPRPPGHVEHVAGGEGDVAQAVQARMQHGGDVSAHGGFS